jgi:ABC-type uncharacterized transport system substrate-binding protein
VSRSAKAPLLAAALALAGAAGARAAEVLAVLSSDSSHYRQAYEGFQEAWGSPVPAQIAGSVSSARVDAVVAFGSRAAVSEEAESPLLVTCLAPGAALERRGTLIRVSLVPSADALAERLKKLLPGLAVLRVLWTSEYERDDVLELAAAARRRGFKVISERVENPDALPERVRAFSGRADALWLTPDPVLVNARNFAILREYAKAARVPFLAPTEGLAEKGATATLAVSFRDVGRAAAEALKARLAGGSVPERVHPDRVVVTLNAAAAREIGLDPAKAGGVDRTLR